MKNAKNRNMLIFVGVVTVIVLPTLGAVGLYHVTQDPNLRPLGVTQDSLFGPGVQVVADVDWNAANTGGYSKSTFEKAITSAFYVRGVTVKVKFHNAARTQVTYQVGDSEIGPFPPARAAEGINAAIEAYKMFPTTRRQ